MVKQKMQREYEYCVIGAGVTGLTFAKAKSLHGADCLILEKDSMIGGIAGPRQIDNIPFHRVGGHCFNSKNKSVMDFIFNNVMPKDEFNIIQRNAKIKFDFGEIDYPIELNLKQLYQYKPKLAVEIIQELIQTPNEVQAENLEKWFRAKFGNALSELYLLKYNRKIWNKHPKNMSPSWIAGKLPIPDKETIIRSFFEDADDTMPHFSFYYPKSQYGQMELINKLSKGLNIYNDYSVTKIEKIGDKWLINGDIIAKHIISTIPLNLLPSVLCNTPESVIEAAKKLKYNKVSTALFRSKPTNKTWTYLPDSSSIFHRYIHIGNFTNQKQDFTIAESIGERSRVDMIQECERDEFLVEYIDSHVSEHAYVVYDENRESAVKTISDYLQGLGLHSIGRFGEWEYYNMDVCMSSALSTARIV